MRKITLRVLAILLVNLNFLFGDITGNVLEIFLLRTLLYQLMELNKIMNPVFKE